ncbi:DUF7521 family protein [Halorientalis halophila]|uniref:DUF7521 family protein n=1 Tax=Halorientalis halophila TaxID=3108499 RepID=UPI003008C031
MSGLLVPLGLVTEVATLLIGTFVAYQSYRGYRRNESPAMLALAVGLVLMIPVASLVRLAIDSFALVGTTQSALIFQAISIVGLLVVFYGLVQD